VYLNTIQGALGSFLSSSGPSVFPLQYQNLDVFFSLSISEVFVGKVYSFELFPLLYFNMILYYKDSKTRFDKGHNSVGF
jgi:hypothetical protein